MSAGLEGVIQDHSSSELNYVSCTPSGVDLSLEPALDLYLMRGFSPSLCQLTS